MRKFKKSFSVDGAVIVEVEFEDGELEYMTEEEIIEEAEAQLFELAVREENYYELVDDLGGIEEIFE